MPVKFFSLGEATSLGEEYSEFKPVKIDPVSYPAQAKRLGKYDKILWDFEIQKDNQIPARKLDLILINLILNNKKKNWPSCGFYCSSEPQEEN